MEVNAKALDGNKCAVIWVPEDTVAFKVVATLLNDDMTFSKAECEYSIQVAKEAFKDGDLWEEENSRYIINYDRLEGIKNDD